MLHCIIPEVCSIPSNHPISPTTTPSRSPSVHIHPQFVFLVKSDASASPELAKFGWESVEHPCALFLGWTNKIHLSFPHPRSQRVQATRIKRGRGLRRSNSVRGSTKVIQVPRKASRILENFTKIHNHFSDTGKINTTQNNIPGTFLNSNGNRIAPDIWNRVCWADRL